MPKDKKEKIKRKPRKRQSHHTDISHSNPTLTKLDIWIDELSKIMHEFRQEEIFIGSCIDFMSIEKRLLDETTLEKLKAVVLNFVAKLKPLREKLSGEKYDFIEKKKTKKGDK